MDKYILNNTSTTIPSGIETIALPESIKLLSGEALVSALHEFATSNGCVGVIEDVCDNVIHIPGRGDKSGIPIYWVYRISGTPTLSLRGNVGVGCPDSPWARYNERRAYTD